MNGLPLPKSSADFPDNPEYEYPKSEKDVVIALPYCLYKESFSPLIKDRFTEMSAIIDLLFHSIRDANTVRLGDIAHITNGIGDVQDANTEHKKDWFPFFDRSEELKWFPTYSFDKEAIIYAGEGQSFYPRYYNGKFALHQRCYAITDFASCILPKYCYYFMTTLNSYFVRNSVGSTTTGRPASDPPPGEGQTETPDKLRQ